MVTRKSLVIVMESEWVCPLLSDVVVVAVTVWFGVSLFLEFPSLMNLFHMLQVAERK